jgi:hypothetical protein
MRPSLLLTLAFFCALIDHAQAANDPRIGCGRFFYEGTRVVGGAQRVAQATSRTGGYDLYPGGGSPGGIPSRGVIYHSMHEHSGGAYQSGGYPGGTYPGGSNVGGSISAGAYPGGVDPGGTFPGGSSPRGSEFSR